jgi:hypothetical protein
MSNVKKLMMTAAGGDEAINVEDVYSQYMYDGKGSKTQGVENGVALGNFGLGTSTEFDGYNDYLLRSTDLSNNTSSKTFTISFWVYDNIGTNGTSRAIYYIFDGSTYYSFEVYFLSTDGYLRIRGRNSSGTVILDQKVTTAARNPNYWMHILLSFDLSDTSKRHYAVNDVVGTPSNTTYTNQAIAFNNGSPQHSIAGSYTGGTLHDGKLAHFYMDFTYRDLTVESNRRLFINADGGSTSPSTLSALNPMIYLPMTADYSKGENIGTGGDFTAYGNPLIVNSGTEYVDGTSDGGMVWIKHRDQGIRPAIYDTARGASRFVIPSDTTVEQNDTGVGVIDFHAKGFTLKGSHTETTGTNERYMSWTFKKQPSFFDVVQYTGTGSVQNIAHNLGSVPGMIWVKNRDVGSAWSVYHRAVHPSTPEDYRLALDSTASRSGDTTAWNGTQPTSSQFTVGTSSTTNNNGSNYIAYIFAHNDGDGIFGPTGDQDIIKCGGYTGNGSSSNGPEIDLGFEPQFVLIKSGFSDGWVVMDTARGFESNTFRTKELFYIDTTGAEFVDDLVRLTDTGFKVYNNSSKVNTNNYPYIYMAIRRGNMGVPTRGTDVFAVINATCNGSINGFDVNHNLINPDMVVQCQRTAAQQQQKILTQRKHGETYISRTNQDTARANIGVTYTTLYRENSGYLLDKLSNPQFSVPNNNDVIFWMWKRAQGYFDILEYVGDGTDGQRIDHYLGAVPAMMWIKNESGNNAWAIWHKELNGGVNAEDYYLGFDQQFPSNTGNVFGKHNSFYPTDTQFEVGSSARTNSNGNVYNAYLFGEVEGVTKMGSYSGNGSTQNIDCGFTNGARFVLIKAVSGDGAAAWLTLDVERGILSGSGDRVLKMHDGNAETSNTDSVDPLSSGFKVVQNTTLHPNKSGSTYIYYAIA